jgi:hypothetical protein
VRSKNPENFERRKKLFHITLAGQKGIWGGENLIVDIPYPKSSDKA